MKITYRGKSIIKQALGICLGIAGFLLVQRVIEGFMDYLIFFPGDYTELQTSQMVVFVRLVVVVVYLFVSILYSVFSDNSIDKIFCWMGRAEKRIISEIVKEEEEEVEVVQNKSKK